MGRRIARLTRTVRVLPRYERKHIDTASGNQFTALTTFTTTNSIFPTRAIVQGGADTDRIGDRLSLVSYMITGTLNLLGDTAYEIVRVVIAQMKNNPDGTISQTSFINQIMDSAYAGGGR